jgi:hypothetical protein
MYERQMPPRPMRPGPSPGGRRPPSRHHRRRKRRAAKLGLAGALTGVLGIAVIAAAIVLLRPGPGDQNAGSGGAGDGGPASVPSPKAGTALSLTTPEGYGYGVAAVKAGTSTAPLPGAKPPGQGETYAYADYVITNTQRRPVLLDYPADLFMPLAQVPASARSRCMPQAGVPEDMCTLPNHSQITARIGDSKPPATEGADQMIPAGASYLVRVATDLPVNATAQAGDLKLYVWNARYTTDRKGIEMPFPE